MAMRRRRRNLFSSEDDTIRSPFAKLDPSSRGIKRVRTAPLDQSSSSQEPRTSKPSFRKSSTENLGSKEIFKTNLHIPPDAEKIPGREKECRGIWKFIADCCAKNKGGSLYCYGNPGTGKTLTTMHIARKYSVEHNVPMFHMCCKENASSSTDQIIKTFYQLLEKNLDKTMLTKPKHQKDSFATCMKVVQGLKKPVIMVMDEFDQLDVTVSSGSMISNFWSLAGHGKLVLITIANNLMLSCKNAKDVPGGVNNLPFSVYTRKQLRAILDERAKIVHSDLSVFDPAALDLLLEKASNESGDCRLVLALGTKSIESAKGDKISRKDALDTIKCVVPSQLADDSASIIASFEDVTMKMILYAFCMPLMEIVPTRNELSGMTKKKGIKESTGAEDKDPGARNKHLSPQGMDKHEIKLRYLENRIKFESLRKNNRGLKRSRMIHVTEGEIKRNLDNLIDYGLVEKIKSVGRSASVERYKLIHPLECIKNQLQREFKKEFERNEDDKC